MRSITIRGNERFWDLFEELKGKGSFASEDETLLEALVRLDWSLEEEAKGRKVVSVPVSQPAYITRWSKNSRVVLRLVKSDNPHRDPT